MIFRRKIYNQLVEWKNSPLKYKYKNNTINLMVVSTKTYNPTENELNIPIYMFPFV